MNVIKVGAILSLSLSIVWKLIYFFKSVGYLNLFFFPKSVTEKETSF